MRFTEKVAVVTGAGRGIGEAYARGLAGDGAAVAVADLDLEAAQEVATTIEKAGGHALAVAVDVADPASGEEMAAVIERDLGGIDFLVNNAAIYGGMKIDSLLHIDLAYYQRFMQVNLNGALFVTRACFPAMRRRGGGAIVNQSSTASWMAVSGYYGLAKAGINSLTVNLAAEMAGSNIRVNAIAPGPIDTDATREVVPEGFIDPLVQSLAIKRLGRPEDLVGACLFLLSEEASWLTGQILAVDGGQIVRI